MRAYWKQLQDRSLIPTLERLLAKPELAPRSFTSARTALLSGFLDLDIGAARPYVLAEIERPDSTADIEVLGRLPEKQLPELDAPLLSMIQSLAPLRERGDFLLLQK